MEQKVKISELKVGDIILYEGVAGDKLDEIIEQSTDSTVTHTAMVESVKDGYLYVVEENVPSAMVVVTNDTTKEPGSIYNRTTRKAYILRRNGTGEDGNQKPVDIAKYYAEAPALPFAETSFVFTAIYLMFNKKTASKRFHKMIMDVIGLAMLELDSWTNQKTEKGYPMVCSQFAYHCFNQAGKDFQIELADDRHCNLIEDILKFLKGEPEKKLSDLNQDELLLSLSNKNSVDMDAEMVRITEELKRLKKEEQQPKQVIEEVEAVLGIDFKFIRMIVLFFIKIAGNLIQNFDPSDLSWSHIITLMYSTMYDYFVSPGDIFRATNLEQLGILDYGAE